MALTLLFPDTLIADPAPLRHASVQAGRKCLQRARVVDRITDGSALPAETLYEQWLRRQFALPPPFCPEAASAYVDGAVDAQWRLTPVHLHLGLDQMVLTDPTQLRLDQASAQGFADAIAATLSAADMSLHVGSPNRWYLTAPKDFDLSAFSWRVASGRSIDGFQPIGPSARRWRQVLTEIQMIWYEHPLNQQRSENGLPVLNSLWLDGRIGAGQRFDYDLCCSDWTSVHGLVASVAPKLGHSVKMLGLSQLDELLINREQRALVVFDPTKLAAAASASEHELNDAVNTSERLGAHWQRLLDTITRPGLMPRLAGVMRAASREPVRIILTGDRVAVALELHPFDHLALMRQLPFDELFEAGERALLRDTG
jgi:hypothetical protein